VNKKEASVGDRIPYFGFYHYQGRFYFVDLHYFRGGGAIDGESGPVVDDGDEERLASVIGTTVNAQPRFVDSPEEIPKPRLPVYKAAGLKSQKALDKASAPLTIEILQDHAIVQYRPRGRNPFKENDEIRRIDSVDPRAIAAWLIANRQDFA
jgi:hypothetical protein